MKIVVTGSLGRIGKPLTEELVKKGHSVTVITTNADRVKDIEALGATAAVGRMEDIDFMADTYRGADVIHAMIPPSHDEPNTMERGLMLGKALAEAIEKSGVKQVVYVSSYGAQLPKGTGLIVGHHHFENALNKITTIESLTHLRATYIYYNLYAYVNMIKNAGFIAANYGGDDRVVMVAPEDIAMTALHEIEHQVPGNHVKYVASDSRTCNEIAQVLGKAIGKPDLKWLTISNEEMQKGMESFGVPSATAAELVEMFGAIHTNLLHEDYDLHTPEFGKVKIEDFAKEFAAVYNK